MEDSSKFESFVDGYRYDFGITHERIDGVDERLLGADGRLESHARLIRNINQMVGDLDTELRELRNEVERVHHNAVMRDDNLRNGRDARPFVVVPGTFDPGGGRNLHAGHVNLLRRASRLGRVRVSLGSQRWAEERKGRLIASYEFRAEVLMRTGLVWEVDHRERDDTLSLGGILIHDDYVWGPLPSMIVAGSDWEPDSFLEHHGLTWGDLERLEIGVAIFPRTPGVSSSGMYSVS